MTDETVVRRYMNLIARIHTSDILELNPDKAHVLLLPEWDREVAAHAMNLAVTTQRSIDMTEHLEPGQRIMYVAVTRNTRGDLRVREVGRSEAERIAGWVEEAEA